MGATVSDTVAGTVAGAVVGTAVQAVGLLVTGLIPEAERVVRISRTDFAILYPECA